MNELSKEQRMHALEAFRKEMRIHSSWSDADAELHLEWPTWLRSWQLATQAAYERLATYADHQAWELEDREYKKAVSEKRALVCNTDAMKWRDIASIARTLSAHSAAETLAAKPKTGD